MQTMMRLKSAKMLDKTTESVLDNAFYQCKPPERVEREEEVVPPLHQYVIHVFSELTDDNCEDILKQVCCVVLFVGCFLVPCLFVPCLLNAFSVLFCFVFLGRCYRFCLV